ncbi:hypothetical protein [Inquilinus limosus]|uniref:Uncharacterized protein n=1 Tax=Inquilinus limosus TaxID=171674 RepID=A0A211ZM37_9PROT|nr:hypothetical protein [Inquilinus limosus]OWJ66345.1 hypothetical protein BWR60_15070 [Inquilinus limosus]
MQGIVHVTPAIWLRDEERSPVCLGDADDLADWLGRTCALLMRNASVGDRQVLELEGLLARVEAVIDAGDPFLPAELRRDIVATVARLNGLWAAGPNDDASAPAPRDASRPGEANAIRRPALPPLRLYSGGARRRNS